MWCIALWIICVSQVLDVQAGWTCSSGFQATILGTCADINECQGSAPCSKGTCQNTNGDYYCDDSKSIDKRVSCGSVTCDNFARCTNDKCVCQPGYTGPTCSVQLSCDKMCRNGGTCNFDGTQEVCICANSYTGSECQYSLNICAQSTSVCLNGGSCAYGTFNKFPNCDCQGSNIGLFCEATSNCSTHCYSNNFGLTCSASCPCSSTTYGDACNYKFDCNCENGGVSVPDDTNSCRCVCPAGTSGATCADDTINECSSSPCLNGGTCVDQKGYYTCQCTHEYSGYNCGVRCELNRNCIWKDCLQCKNKFADGVCDSECNNEVCLFDGFDCNTKTSDVCNGTYDNGTAIQDLSELCAGNFDDNVCVSVNGSTAQKYCVNEVCGGDGSDCVTDKRKASNIIGVIVVDFVIKSVTSNETLLNETTPTLFGKYMPYLLSAVQGHPGIFARRLTTDAYNVGTGAEMINYITPLKYRIFYNVINKPDCGSVPSAFPCWSNITSVSRLLALTATGTLSTFVDSIAELFPCTEGYYGDKCTMACSSNCQSNSGGRTCEMDSGKCISGCSSSSYTGDNCNVRCGSNCIGSCLSTTGICSLTASSTRCSAGYQGLYCNETCSTDTFGIDCAYNCSSNCEAGTCSTLTGHCTCKAGYTNTDPTCRTECTSGTYGSNCVGTCNTCGKGVACSIVDGSCPTCPLGKIGSKCDQDCPDYSYGASCASSCSANCDAVCDKTNGTCSPCKSGYEGYYCTIKSKSNEATLADPTSDMQATIVAAIIIIVSLLVIAAIIGFILWRRQQGAQYEVHEVEPLNTKKPNADDNGHPVEMKENLGFTTATVEHEKMNGEEARPLLEHSDKVYAGDRTEENGKLSVEQENTSNDTSSTAPLPGSTRIDDVQNGTERDAGNSGPKIDFKYIDGIESRDPSLEDVRGTAAGEMNTEPGLNSDLTETVTTDRADE